jgi:hypothetical protein
VAESYPKSGRTESQIEADLGATRDRIASSLTELVDEVHPLRIKARTIGRIKAAVQARVDDARAYVFNARGDLRTDRLMTIGGAAAGVLTFVLVLRRFARRHRG